KTFQHMTCRGVSYHETPAGAVDSSGKPAPADCPRRIFLPVNDGRMIAVDADDGRLCDGFGDHGTLNLQDGLGITTAGFFEPTSPPVVSDKILVVAAAVIDNYSTEVPSGVVRGFDVYTGRLVWAWDSGAADENALPSTDKHYTISSPNSWITASYDPKLNLVYLPMGNHGPDIWGGNRDPLAERYASSLVALDIDTGKRAWSYQTVHHDPLVHAPPVQPVAGRPCYGQGRRPRHHPADQDRQSLRSGPPQWRADRAGARTCGAAGRGTRRSYRADATLLGIDVPPGSV